MCRWSWTMTSCIFPGHQTIVSGVGVGFLFSLSLSLHSHTGTQQEHTRLYLCVRVCVYINPETHFCILAHQVSDARIYLSDLWADNIFICIYRGIRTLLTNGRNSYQCLFEQDWFRTDWYLHQVEHDSVFSRLYRSNKVVRTFLQDNAFFFFHSLGWRNLFQPWNHIYGPNHLFRAFFLPLFLSGEHSTWAADGVGCEDSSIRSVSNILFYSLMMISWLRNQPHASLTQKGHHAITKWPDRSWHWRRHIGLGWFRKNLATFRDPKLSDWSLVQDLRLKQCSSRRNKIMASLDPCLNNAKYWNNFAFSTLSDQL